MRRLRVGSGLTIGERERFTLRRKLGLLGPLALVAGILVGGAGPSAADPNNNASCVAQTGSVLGPPGTGEDGGPIGGDVVSMLAQFPRTACPGVGSPVP